MKEAKQIADYNTRPFDKLPEDQAAHVEHWLAVNQLNPSKVKWSLYPIGMVGTFIERAHEAESKLGHSQCEVCDEPCGKAIKAYETHRAVNSWVYFCSENCKFAYTGQKP